LIEIDGVSKRYNGQGKLAVDNLSIKIEAGEICVFIGPSGCGKSTTLRMINRMIEPSNGTIKIDGEDITKSNPDKLRMRIGYVIQQIGLLPHKTVGENIAIVPRLYGWPKELIEKRVVELLDTIGLDAAVEKDKYPSQLSGGQMQRVGVARAMAVDPSIMLMDEPFGAVDPIARTRLQDEFLRLQKNMKKTICFVTHDIDEAIKMGDKIAIFNEGKLVQFDTPSNILTNPAGDFVKDFIGSDRLAKRLKLISAGEIAKRIDSLSGCEMMHAIEHTASIQETMSFMIEKDAEYVGVINKGKLSGMISFADIRSYMNKRAGV